MENKRKNVYITIFVITTVIAGVIALYFGMENTKLRNANNTKETKQEEKAATNDNEITKGEATVKEVEKFVEKYENLELKINKENCLNSEADNISYIMGTLYSSYSSIYSCSASGKTITISANLEEFNKNFNGYNGKTFDISKYNSQNYVSVDYSFNEQIVDVLAMGIGQGVVTENIFLLVVLKDGSLYCMNMYDAIMDNNYKNFVKIEETSNIIKIHTASKKIVVDENGAGPGWVTLVAFNDQGKFYDLENILRNKNLAR